MSDIVPLEPDVATKLLRNLINDAATKFNRVNGNGKKYVEHPHFTQSDLIQACLQGRVIGNCGASSNASFYKYTVRSRSLQNEGCFIDLEVIMDSKQKILKVLKVELLK